MNSGRAIEQQEKTEYYKEDVGNEVNYAESYRAVIDYRTRASGDLSDQVWGSGTLMS